MKDLLEGMPVRTFSLRVTWIVIRLALAIVLMGPGSYFLYQGF